MEAILRERKKSLGAFYTPVGIAQAMADWAIRLPGDRVLDPAAGEAVFISAAIARFRSLDAQPREGQLLGVEVDPDAYDRAGKILAAEHWPHHLRLRDFFSLRPTDLGAPFDAVIGNPPYIRYHRFSGDVRVKALAAAAGVKLNRLTNSWAPFVVQASRFLSARGRLAVVLPSEILHADYAAPVREFLLRRFANVTVVTFEEAVFPGAMIDAVLLLADQAGDTGLRVTRYQNVSELDLARSGTFRTSYTDRWSRLRVPEHAISILDDLEAADKLQRLSEVASVDIGCVTGATDFFVLSRAEAEAARLPKDYLRPIVTRPALLTGSVLTDDDIGAFSPTVKYLLLAAPSTAEDRETSTTARYLRVGRQRGIHQRYKCRVRLPWHVVPGVRVPHAFLSYMSHRTPRIVLNEAGVSSTNLVHQIDFRDASQDTKRALISVLHSSLCLLSFEVEGRSYGGGVLKLETREAERVRLPRLNPRAISVLSGSLGKVDSLELPMPKVKRRPIRRRKSRLGAAYR